MKRSLYTVIALLVTSASAHAVWNLEPAIGYQMGSSSTKLTGTTTTSDYAETGILAGLRFNYIFGNRMTFGADYQILSGGKSTPTTGTASDMTKSEGYITIGYNAGRWNTYLGYAPTATMALTASGSTSTTTYTGTATKVGFSFDFKPHFGMGIEYIMPSYLTFSPAVLGVSDVSKLFSTFNATSYNVNFSFPFIF